jgi:RHS repeat-associated protein
VWQQNFSYDNNAYSAGVTGGAFGNVIKTVPTGGTGNSFQPTYNIATNRISALPGSTPSYDNNGNVLNDSLDQYTWDAEGRPVTMAPVGGGTVSLTFDALGRMVEQSTSGAYTQIVYGPTGSKLALMSGQSLTKAFVPMPGGATAVYNSSGLAYYRHADWLGTSRFASTPSRTMYGDVAYGPFGEVYAQAGTTDLSFTGQNSDTAGGSYDFLSREYSIQGRWPSPDPAGLAAVDPTNPQSWNRFVYVANSPLNSIDQSVSPATTSRASSVPQATTATPNVASPASPPSGTKTAFVPFRNAVCRGSLPAREPIGFPPTLCPVPSPGPSPNPSPILNPFGLQGLSSTNFANTLDTLITTTTLTIPGPDPGIGTFQITLPALTTAQDIASLTYALPSLIPTAEQQNEYAYCLNLGGTFAYGCTQTSGGGSGGGGGGFEDCLHNPVCIIKATQ